jgi:hypothetical protein
MMARRPAFLAIVVFVVVSGPADATAQRFTYRGYAEAAILVYPQTAPNDDDRVIADGLLRVEPAWEIQRGVVVGGAFDVRADTHRETTQSAEVSFWDRTTERPTLAIRRLTFTFARGPISIEAGKQFVRWGQTDILAPTDRFAPRDYLTVPASELLAVTAARVTVAGKGHSLEAVYTPRLTPSRMPILTHRWIGLEAATAASASGLTVRDIGARYPRRSQYGLRWNHVGRWFEHSIAFFQGFNSLPLTPIALNPPGVGGAAGTIDVRREYPAIQVWGGDIVAPLSAFALKAEAAWVRSRDHDADEYALYVVQMERQHRDWLFIGGYVGEVVFEERQQRSFEPDRGLARAIFGRASYTLGATRSVTFESMVRQDGDGVLAKAEYAHGLGQHWRVTLRMIVIRGAETDFLGQYRRNSFGGTQVRYSF